MSSTLAVIISGHNLTETITTLIMICVYHIVIIKFLWSVHKFLSTRRISKM